MLALGWRPVLARHHGSRERFSHLLELIPSVSSHGSNRIQPPAAPAAAQRRSRTGRPLGSRALGPPYYFPATTTAMRTAILSRVSRIASQTSSRNVPRIRPDAPAPAYPLCPASATPAHALGCSPILRASPAHPTRASLKPALGTDTTEYRPTQAIEERSSMASNASRPKPGDPGGRNDGIAHKAPWAHLSQ